MKLIPQSEIEKAAGNYSGPLPYDNDFDAFIAGAKYAERYIKELLEMTIQINEDDFDRGNGKHIIKHMLI